MDEQNLSDGTRQHQISNLRRTVEQLRLNLYALQERAAHYGSFEVPLHLKNDIDETKARLREVENQFRELRSSGDGRLSQNTALKQFWEPFVMEGAQIIVSQYAPDETIETQNKVNTLTMQAVFNMHHLLIEQFADTHNVSDVQLALGGVSKSDTYLERLTTSDHPHLIVIGAPGAQPLSNYLLAQFKGIEPYESMVEQGLVFRVTGDYLGSPFIVSDEMITRYPQAIQEVVNERGIYDLKPDGTVEFFPRTFVQFDKPTGEDKDCALIATGWASLPGESRIRRVVVIGGHSRHSTLFGTAFVTTNEEWAQQVNLLQYSNTETVIGIQSDSVGASTAPVILAGPREIYKQI